MINILHRYWTKLKQWYTLRKLKNNLDIKNRIWIRHSGELGSPFNMVAYRSCIEAEKAYNAYLKEIGR